MVNSLHPSNAVVLPYQIKSFSGYSANFHPRNIMANQPMDQSSRWASDSTGQHHFILVKLDHLSLVQLITFGKYHKSHVCNLKEFKVYGGLEEDNLVELFHGGLRNDTEAETFPLKNSRSIHGKVIFPCLYLKIVPLSAHGGSFMYSIWFVELRGIMQTQVVQRVLKDYQNFKQVEAMKLCLKHLRKSGFEEEFQSLLHKTGLCLEDAHIKELFDCIVHLGDFGTAETLIKKLFENNSSIFDEYISKCSYRPQWHRIDFRDDQQRPFMRGGHQMCLDSARRTIYLLGGWDGNKDLSDFWSFSMETREWRCISRDMRLQGGPGPRSCHKIYLDQSKGLLYVLGRYIDPDIRPTSPLECDFFCFDIHTERWEMISPDTKANGGPQLMYDHQICMDEQAQILYVFGGRTITATSSEMTYSGLYSYNVERKEWKLIRSDSDQPFGTVHLKSRIGHSMLFHSKTKQLYVFAGQRNKDYLGDFYIYDVNTDTVLDMTCDSSKQNGPDAGFTQRATMDEELDELYVLSGLMREKNTNQETFKNAFWVYSLSRDQWTRVYCNENTDPSYWTRMQDTEPCPRYAHQLVYDSVQRVHYLFGGNPGEAGNLKQRLDDFWELFLARPTSKDILLQCQFLLRRQQFIEMAPSKPIEALNFLQQEIAQVACEKGEEFHGLSLNLFRQGEQNVMTQRYSLMDCLMNYFPERMKQPKIDLTDLI